ncbi:MAG: M15 family metallopeptidase [Paludibacteraceae bacterium]|nr:M15 family metallopeptidase [Paludibacteraceae bacterium]
MPYTRHFALVISWIFLFSLSFKGLSNPLVQTGHISMVDSIDCCQNYIPKNKLLGHYNPAQDTNFVLIPSYMAYRKNLYCHREAYNAFCAMRRAAQKEGIKLVVVSATRTFNDQKHIWDRKWKEHNKNTYTDTTMDIRTVRSIMRYSSMPGTSRHHWGTELDLNSTKLEYWRTSEGVRAYKWLSKNASKYGYYQPYNANKERTGYAEEKWHWSYRPIADIYLAAYTQLISGKDIEGFYGSYLVDSLNIISSHVLGVAQ